MKRLAVLALILLALPMFGRAQDDDGLYFFNGKVEEMAVFTLEFARKFEHRPVLLRGLNKPEKNLFATASLKFDKDFAVVSLRNQPYHEDLDNLERQPTVNLGQMETDQGEPFVLVIFDDKGIDGRDQNPNSITRTFQDALLKALDGKFKRRKTL